jgi:hypothetical protein
MLRGPRVAHRCRLGHELAGHHYRVAVNRSRGPVEFLVLTCVAKP